MKMPSEKLGWMIFLSVQTATCGVARAADYFVKWKTPPSTIEQKTFENRHQLKIIWTSTLVPGLQAFETLDSKRPLDLQTTQFEYIEPNHRVRRSLPPIRGFDLKPHQGQVGATRLNDLAPPSDSHWGRQWAMTAATGIQPLPAWEVTRGSPDIIVAVIDTGVDASHPDLQGRVLMGYDFIDNVPLSSDIHGHGTHVSGIIAAQVNNGLGIAGVNPEVRILPIRAVPSDGDETDLNVIKAFEYAVAQGARIANCSFGKAKSSRAVGDVIAASEAKGLLVVVAAGNDGNDNSYTPHFPSNFRTPNMIVVAASGVSGDITNFSNYGTRAVDLAAPGAGILSTVPGGQYASKSGTSMASPYVAGVAALALSVRPSMTPRELRVVVMSSVQPVPVLKRRVISGGLVNAFGAVEKARISIPH